MRSYNLNLIRYPSNFRGSGKADRGLRSAFGGRTIGVGIVVSMFRVGVAGVAVSIGVSRATVSCNARIYAS